MAKGYPGRTRARRAYTRGLIAAARRNRFNPYAHPRLHALFERGLEHGLRNPNLIPPQRHPAGGNRPPPARTGRRDRTERRDRPSAHPLGRAGGGNRSRRWPTGF